MQGISNVKVDSKYCPKIRLLRRDTEDGKKGHCPSSEADG
jgi:hypothetical protein